MTCPWPTGWRQPESLGEAQLARRVRGQGADCGGGAAWAQRGRSVPRSRGALAWAPVCSALSAVHPRGCCAPPGAAVHSSPPSLEALLLTLVSPSRVHITEATLKHLDKAYEVEDGHGQQRDPYLKEMNIRTYLVIDPRVRGSAVSGRGWVPCRSQGPHLGNGAQGESGGKGERPVTRYVLGPR